MITALWTLVREASFYLSIGPGKEALRSYRWHDLEEVLDDSCVDYQRNVNILLSLPESRRQFRADYYLPQLFTVIQIYEDSSSYNHFRHYRAKDYQSVHLGFIPLLLNSMNREELKETIVNTIKRNLSEKLAVLDKGTSG